MYVLEEPQLRNKAYKDTKKKRRILPTIEKKKKKKKKKKEEEEEHLGLSSHASDRNVRLQYWHQEQKIWQKKIKQEVVSRASRKHTYIILAPLNPTYI